MAWALPFNVIGPPPSGCRRTPSNSRKLERSCSFMAAMAWPALGPPSRVVQRSSTSTKVRSTSIDLVWMSLNPAVSQRSLNTSRREAAGLGGLGAVSMRGPALNRETGIVVSSFHWMARPLLWGGFAVCGLPGSVPIDDPLCRLAGGGHRTSRINCSE